MLRLRRRDGPTIYKIEGAGCLQTRLKNSEKFLTRAGTKPRDPPSKEAQGREQKCYKGISGKAEPAAAKDGRDPETR